MLIYMGFQDLIKYDWTLKYCSIKTPLDSNAMTNLQFLSDSLINCGKLFERRWENTNSLNCLSDQILNPFGRIKAI
jgi:hypothetical protein